jgi:hypothetical protein
MNTQPTPDNSAPLKAIDVLEAEYRFIHERAPYDLDQILPKPDPHDPRSPEQIDADNEIIREKALREKLHGLEEKNKNSAICFSGGGVRSATFCLGALQALAEKRWLDGFHYMSSVSGGGYIASWLSSWIAREDGDTAKVLDQIAPARKKPKDRPAAPEPLQVRRLRAYSNYLSPVHGMSIDLITLIATFMRNLALHWLVLLPLLGAIVMMPRIMLAITILSRQSMSREWFWPLQCVAAISAGAGFVNILRNLPSYSTRQSDKSDFIRWCFIPILAGVTLEGCILPIIPNIYPEHQRGILLPIYILAGAVLSALCKVLVAEKKSTADQGQSYTQKLLPIAAAAAIAGLLLFVITELFMKSLAKGGEELGIKTLGAYSVLCVPAILSALWISMTIYVGMSRAYTPEEDREWWARASAWIFWAIAGWSVLSAVVIFGPYLLLETGFAAYIGTSAGVLGLATSASGYWSKQGARIERKVKGIAGVLGERALEAAAAIFILGLLVLLSIATVAITRGSTPAPQAGVLWTPDHYSRLITCAPPEWVFATSIVLILVCVVCSHAFGINTFSLHNMYGNRLVRAYLGATNNARDAEPFTGFDPRDNRNMQELYEAATKTATQKRRLFHVINIALNLVKPSQSRLDWQQRKAAAFTVSPLHTGSPGTGYRPSDMYAGKGGITLGRAMTISGAAASSSMGYHTSTLVAFVMTFFNIRLGWWLPNPGKKGRTNLDFWTRNEPRGGVVTLAKESLANTTDDSNYVYLSDGGHFENLGLYEMVRRRCHRILVVDASCDPEYRFEDLENAIRKIRVDFGISIEFPDGLPTPAWSRETQRHSTTGVIRYSDVDGPDVAHGKIIYIKPVLSGDEPFDITRYAAMTSRKQRNPFPHHSTADQFFDEIQFESYRALGYHSVMQDTLLGAMASEHVWPAAGGAAASPGKEELAKEETTDGGAAGGSGVLDGLRAAGQTGVMWGAITIGGMLSVAGVVTLRNPEVTLKQPAEVSVKPVAQQPPSLPGPDVIREPDRELTQRLAELLTVMERLETSVATNTQTSTTTIAEMHKLLDRELEFVKQHQNAANQQTVNNIVAALVRAQIQLGNTPNKPVDLGHITETIDNIHKLLADSNFSERLRSIDAGIQKANPRTNVRPTEGSRP